MPRIRAVWVSVLFSLWAAPPSSAQGIPQEQIDAFLQEGEVDKAESALKEFLDKPDVLSYQDSVYLLKHLGVLYASNPKKQAEAERLFYRLLELDPFSSLHDTYAGSAILGRFQKIRRDVQRKKGGKALIPPVVVFDFQGAGFSAEERVALTNQFICEMQKLLIFHTLDRPLPAETIRRMRKTPENCADRGCLLDIARRLMAEYMVMPEVSRIDSAVVFQMAFVAVPTGQNSTVLRKVYDAGDMAKVLAEGLPDLARSLQDQEAAWLNLSVQPPNTLLTLDGSPLAAIGSRLPVNPGKHRVCGGSPGYDNLCRDFEVKKMDAVTYSLALKRTGGGEDESGSRGKVRENWDDDPTAFSEESDSGGKGPSKKVIWMVLGGMAALVAGLAVLWAAN